MSCALYITEIAEFHLTDCEPPKLRPAQFAREPRPLAKAAALLLKPTAARLRCQSDLTSAEVTVSSTMKRSHNYSSSDSDLDDNVDVEKDSGDENG